MQTPSWLDATAKAYWRKLYPEIKDQLTAAKGEIFAILCQCLSDYRTAIEDHDTRQKKIMLDQILKFSKDFNLTLKAKASTTTDNSLDEFVR